MSVVKREVALQLWENSEMPTLCESCLGDNPNIRMMREKFGAECKVCLKPYTTFRWCPGVKSRYRKTVICPTCAKAKNVCQSCILDVKYSLPVQVRDKLLGISDDTPKQQINRDFYFQTTRSKHSHSKSNNMVSLSNDTHSTNTQSLSNGNFYSGSNGSAGKEALKSIANTQPHYEHNRPYICSFFLKNECKRGAACPYSHDMLAEQELNRTKIMNRYFGTKDPVAEKILDQKIKLPPALYDKSITSVCIHGIDSQLTKESSIREVFQPFGDIKSVVIVREEQIAFVNYLERHAADSAVDAFLDEGTIVGGIHVTVTWAYGKFRGPRQDYTQESDTFKDESGFVSHSESSTLSGDLENEPDTLPLPGSSSIKYSSMDPNQFGSFSAAYSTTSTSTSYSKKKKF